MKRYIVHLICLMFMLSSDVLTKSNPSLRTQQRHTTDQISSVSHTPEHSPLLLHKSINRSHVHFNRLHRYYHVLYHQAQQCRTEKEKVLMHLSSNPFAAASCFCNNLKNTTHEENLLHHLEIITELETQVQNLVDIGQVLHNVGDVTSIVTGLVQTITSYVNINNLLTEVDDTVDQVGNILTTVISDTQETIQTTIENLLNIAQITTIENLLSIAQNFPQTVDELLSDATQTVDDLVSDVTQTTTHVLDGVTQITDNLLSNVTQTTNNVLGDVTESVDNVVNQITQTTDTLLPQQTIETVYQQIETVINDTTVTLANAPTIVTGLLQSALFRTDQLQYPQAIELLQQTITTNLMLIANLPTNENLRLQAYLQKLLGDTYNLNAQSLINSNNIIGAITQYQLAAQAYTLAGKLYETIAQYPLATQAYSLAQELLQTINP